MATPGHHTLSVLVANKSGVLSRVSGLFSRRGFNIESLAVGPTERHDRSVITIRVDCTKHSVDQVAKQLDKLIEQALRERYHEISRFVIHTRPVKVPS